MTSIESASETQRPDVESMVVPRRGWLQRFVATRTGPIALGFLLVVALLAICAPLISPYDPNAQDLSNLRGSPSSDHWLGTDGLGRDIATRLLYAARISLVAAVQAVGLAAVLGGPFGLIAGYFRGWADAVLGRIADGMMAVPGILLAIALVAALGPSLTNAMIAVGVVYAPRVFRLLRGSTLVVREATFIEASRAVGCSTTRIVFRHVLPNVLAPLTVQLSLMMGFAILAEASLSFLGLGVQPPTASWGSMLSTAFRDVYVAALPVIYPGVAIMLTVLAFNTLGDAIRDSIGREERQG